MASGLTEQNKNDIERLQKSTLKIKPQAFQAGLLCFYVLNKFALLWGEAHLCLPYVYL